MSPPHIKRVSLIVIERKKSLRGGTCKAACDQQLAFGNLIRVREVKLSTVSDIHRVVGLPSRLSIPNT